jgi:hypothetical protein
MKAQPSWEGLTPLVRIDDLEHDVEQLSQQLEDHAQTGGKVVHKHTTTTTNVTEVGPGWLVEECRVLDGW